MLHYDNEAGKGDHRHFDGTQSAYVFTTPDQLIADFHNDIARWTMKTVTLDVRPPTDAMADFANAWKSGKAQKTVRISFATPELLWRVLTEKRWELLKVLCGAGPVSIREAARRAGRDVKAVGGDVTALLNAGLLDRTEDGRIVFPFDAVKVEFLLQAA